MARLLAAIVLASCAALAAGAKEPATGIVFADTYHGSTLAGVGARYKGPIKVYAAGVYVSPFATKVALRKFKGVKETLVGKDFYETMVKEGVPKYIVLKMAISISKEKLANAMSDSVKPRMGGDLEAVPKLSAAILAGFGKDGSAKTGTELAFALAGGSCNVSVNGKKCGTISSRKLVAALSNCYLDGDAVSGGLKKACAAGALKML